MNQFIIAIDPGASGGIAVKQDQKTYAYPMPDTEGDIVDLFKEISVAVVRDGYELIAVVESQTGYVGRQQSAPALFRYGKHYGFLIGALQATGWKVILVTPQKWQKSLGVGNVRNYKSRTDWKNHLKAVAQRLFPKLKVTLAIADALLILEHTVRSPENYLHS